MKPFCLLLGLINGFLILSAFPGDSQSYTFTTIAGDVGYGRTDGTNNTARFRAPDGIAVDAAGNLFVADTYNATIRKLARFGTNWVASTLAGSPGKTGVSDGTNAEARFSYPSG